MSLCSYSSDTHSGSYLIIENSFVNEYLPTAHPSCIKVYLYGLILCSNPNSIENTIDNMSHVLGMDAGELKDAFDYWQAEGLIQMLENEDTHELSIKYLPVSRRSGSSKKRTNKYTEFNNKVQSLIKGRMISPGEYNEYYTMIESFHMDEDALVDIVEYSIKMKGERVGYPYIITIAKNFANEGIKSKEAVADKLNEHAEVSGEMNSVMKVLGLRGVASVNDRNLYIKWTSEFGFGLGVIKDVAKEVKQKSGGIPKLDSLLTKYYNLKLTSIKEINEYREKSEQYYALAREIAKTLGLYYQNLDTVVENYISEWLGKGYDAETLKMLAQYSLRRSVRTMEGMNTTIQRLYKLGLVSAPAIDQYINELVFTDKHIQEILDNCNIVRAVNTWDRDYYRTWTTTWGLSHDIIMFVSDFSKDKIQPIQYMNKVLSGLYESKITTLDRAKQYMEGFKTSFKTENKKNYQERQLNQKDLDALFDNLDNIEI